MLGPDPMPSVQGIWSYSELLLAEMDTQVKAKALATAAAEKPAVETHGKRETSTANCRYFGSDEGCRLGKRVQEKGGGKGQPAKLAVKAATHEPSDGSGGRRSEWFGWSSWIKRWS